MDNDTLADYWRDVSPILKEQAREKRENCFNDRLECAKNNLRKMIFLISYVMKL